MSRQFVIIGLGKFGRRMLEELSQVDCELLLIDKDRDIVEQYKDQVTQAIVVDALKEDAINRIVPATVDAAIVDLSGNVEVSILVTNYLKKMGIKTIVAQATSDEHGEILGLVGATRVVYAFREAAMRVAPLLYSAHLFSYLPLGRNLVIAEIGVPDSYLGKTLVEANFRQRHGLNVVALAREEGEEFSYFSPEYRLQKGDLLLVAGPEEAVGKFAQGPESKRGAGRLGRLLSRLSVRGRAGSFKG